MCVSLSVCVCVRVCVLLTTCNSLIHSGENTQSHDKPLVHLTRWEGRGRITRLYVVLPLLPEFIIIVKVSYSVRLALYPLQTGHCIRTCIHISISSLPLCASYLIGRFRIPVEFHSSDIQHSSQANILEVFHLPSKTV